jgi:hypothetical protein
MRLPSEVLVECRWALFDSAPATELAAQSGQIDAIAVRMGSAHFQGEGLVALALAGWPTVLIGAVARARGLLAFAVGDAGMALDLFAQSERLVRTSPPQMARLRADRARVLLTQAASHGAAIPPEASRLLAESLTAAERLGMARLAADVRALRAD